MSITAWTGRLTTVGASANEVAAITAAYYADPQAQRDALDTLIESLSNAGLLIMLNTWRSSGGPFQAGYPGGGLPFGTHVAILTGNPSDDVNAISAGTGIQLALTASVAAETARAEAAEALLIPLAQRGAASGVGTLDGSGRQPIAQSPLSVVTSSSGIQFSNAPVVGAAVPAMWLADPSGVYGNATIFGNALSFGGSGSGSPTGVYAPVAVNQHWGTNDGANAPVLKTTQAIFISSSYYGPTPDDSMECGNCFVAAKNTGTGYTQANAITAFEGHVQVEGANIASGNVIAIASRVNLNDTSQATGPVYGFRASAPTVAAGASATNYYAFATSGSAAGGTITNVYSFYGHDAVLSERALILGKSGNGMAFKAQLAGSGGGTPAFVYVKNPDSTDFASIRVDAIAGQTQPVFTMFASDGTQGMSIARDGTLQTVAGLYVKTSGGTNKTFIDNNGNTAIQALPISANNQLANSPTLSLQANYDSSGTTTPTAYNFQFRHTMVTGGGSPASKLSLLNNAGTEIWSVDQTGDETGGGSRPPALATALGLKSWNFDPGFFGSSSAPTSQTIYAVAIPLQKGQVISNIVWDLSTPGSGGTPTNIYVGLSDATTVRAISNDLAASSIWTGSARYSVAPLNASYTVPASGVYYGLILQNGSWGTTQMVLNRASGTRTFPNGSFAQATGGTGQTSLPSAGSAITLASSGSPLRFWCGVS